jgi:endonuclease III
MDAFAGKDWNTVIAMLADSVREDPDPSVTKVRKRRESPFAVLVATLISLRTKDEVTEAASERLLDAADSPELLLKLPEERIAGLIYPAGFYKTKARNLLKISEILIDRYGGAVPSGEDELLALPGVGRKTSALVRAEGFGIPDICVDTHVHRVSNRMGIVATKAPDETQARLKELLPRERWGELNPLMVSFGRTVCVPISPKCSVCPFSADCPRTGVARSR